MWRALVLSDLHLTTDDRDQCWHDLRQTLAWAERGELGRLDGILMPGDIADRPEAIVYERLGGELAHLGLPVFAVAGNYDESEALAELTVQLGAPSATESGVWRVELGDWDVLGVDTVPGDRCTQPSEVADQWLSRASRTGGRPLLLMVHQPPFALPGFEDERLVLPGLFPQLVGVRPVVGLSGHLHSGLTTEYQGAPWIVCPALSYDLHYDGEFARCYREPRCASLTLAPDFARFRVFRRGHDASLDARWESIVWRNGA